MQSKKTLTIASVAIILALSIAVGFYFGNRRGNNEGKKSVEEKLSPLVNFAFPKPAEKITNLSGIVKEIFGAVINFEITDPNDYLPHLDGTPQKKELRSASVSRITELFLKTLNKQGNPKTTPIKISDFKVGDTITVYSEQNLRDAKKFDAAKIELLKF